MEDAALRPMGAGNLRRLCRLLPGPGKIYVSCADKISKSGRKAVKYLYASCKLWVRSLFSSYSYSKALTKKSATFYILAKMFYFEIEKKLLLPVTYRGSQYSHVYEAFSLLI
jgi:hypothetical protein